MFYTCGRGDEQKRKGCIFDRDVFLGQVEQGLVSVLASFMSP